MSSSPRPFIRTTAGRLAVAGVAALASVSAVAPAAFADDTDLAPESTELPPTTPETTPEVPAESPAPETGDAASDTSAAPPAPQARTTPSAAPEGIDAGEETGATNNSSDVTAADVEYGPQTIAVSFSRVPGAFYPASGGDSTLVRAQVDIYDEGAYVRSENCQAQLGLTESTPASVECLSLELEPGQRAVVTDLDRGVVLEVAACEIDECSSSPVPVDFTLAGLAPSGYNPTFRDVEPGETVTIDALANDSIGDPATFVEIIGGSGEDRASLGSDGRTISYTSAEDFVGTDTVTFRATNSNGTTESTWRIEVVDPMAPNFGSQKYRVGVQVASGAYVPDGTTTIGSTFEIVTTSEDGVTTTQTCTTVPPANSDGSSFCPGTSDLSAGDRAVITQTEAPEGLLPDPDPVVIEPCDLDVDSCTTVTALFDSPGSILPETQPDTAIADQGGEPIIIDVLANDTSEDPNTGLEVTALPPGQGTIEVVGEAAPPVEQTPGGVGILAVPSAGTLALRYTPPADFSGEVPVEYTVTNSNGSTSETLTITVRAAAELPTDPEGPVIPPTVDVAPAAQEDVTAAPARVGAGSSMPNTGGPAASLLGIGFVLAAAGAGIIGRRRSTATRGR